MQNPMALLTFSFFIPEIPFLGKFGPKNQNCQYAEIWYLNQFEYGEFNGAVHFFCFRAETSLLVNEGKPRAITLPATTGVET